jgi:hypothetical protein
MWAIPGLNTRETALAVWLAMLLAVGLLKPDARRGIAGLLRLFATSGLLGGLIAGAASYLGVAVFSLDRLGYWSWSMTSAAVFWFLFFGLVAMFDTRNVDAGYYRRLLTRNLGAAVAIEFIVNIHTFPLPVELVLVPAALIVVLMQVVADSNPELASVRKLLAWLVTVPGVVAISYSVAYLIGHSSEVLTATKLKEFMLPFVLTAFFLPLIVAVRYFVVWQTLLHMTKAGFRDDTPLYKGTRRRIVAACGLSLAKAQLFESEFRGHLWGLSEEREVTKVMVRFDASWKRGRRVQVDAKVPEI